MSLYFSSRYDDMHNDNCGNFGVESSSCIESEKMTYSITI